MRASLLSSAPSSSFSLFLSGRRDVGPHSVHRRPPARFFPMAEHKTASLLLGTNPVHPGLANGRGSRAPLRLSSPITASSRSLFMPSFQSEAQSFGSFYYFFFCLPQLTSLSFPRGMLMIFFLVFSEFRLVTLASIIEGAARQKSIAFRLLQ